MEYEPQKLAAIEAMWDTRAGQPAVLFALPDEKTETNRYEIAIPKLASLYLTHSLDGTVKDSRTSRERIDHRSCRRSLVSASWSGCGRSCWR